MSSRQGKFACARVAHTRVRRPDNYFLPSLYPVALRSPTLRPATSRHESRGTQPSFRCCRRRAAARLPTPRPKEPVCSGRRTRPVGPQQRGANSRKPERAREPADGPEERRVHADRLHAGTCVAALELSTSLSEREPSCRYSSYRRKEYSCALAFAT